MLAVWTTERVVEVGCGGRDWTGAGGVVVAVGTGTGRAVGSGMALGRLEVLIGVSSDVGSGRCVADVVTLLC